MTGQGRPRTSRTEHPATGSPRAACWALLVALLTLGSGARAEEAAVEIGAIAEVRAVPEDRAPAAAPASDDFSAARPTMRVRIIWGGGACGCGKGPSPSAKARSWKRVRWGSKPMSRARCGWKTATCRSTSEAAASTTAWTSCSAPRGREIAGEPHRCRRRPARPAERNPLERPVRRIPQSAARHPRQPPPGRPHAGRPVARAGGRQIVGLLAGGETAAGGRAAPVARPRRHQDSAQCAARLRRPISASCGRLSTTCRRARRRASRWKSPCPIGKASTT